MKNIRKSKFSKVIASYLALQLIITTIQPFNLFALTGGPSQPEFNSFTPIGTSDMVNLSSGDFNYNIPIMDVGGYPLNLAYDSGVTMDQEASWVGLGWNLNVGQINRQLRGLPDDFNGDTVRYENNLRTNFTAGVNTGIEFPIYGFNAGDALGANANLGIGMEYNNYSGITFNFNYGASFDISEQVSAGLNVTSTSDGSATVEPTVRMTSKKKTTDGVTHRAFSSNIGVPFNSLQGLKGLNMSASLNKVYDGKKKIKGKKVDASRLASGGASGTISFNDNLNYTPTNQLRFANLSLTLKFALGAEFFGAEAPQGYITGFGSVQALRNSDKDREINAYGYAYTENASTINSILDFNRENDKTVTTNTTMLPLVNQTYDLYSINGHGIGGMFRPYRSQVGHVFDETISYTGVGGSASLELGPGLAIHFGGNAKVNPTFTRSGRWQGPSNLALNNFRYKNTQDFHYEPVFYKSIGELTGDSDSNYTNSLISEPNPMKFQIGGGEYNRRLLSSYDLKQYGADNTISYTQQNASVIKRSERELRNQSIQMIKYAQVKDGQDGQIRINNLPDVLEDPDSNYLVPDDHQVGVKVLKPDGSTYVYGEAAYNTRKIEASFATNSNGNCLTGMVNYQPNENTRDNSSGRDHYVNKVHTPPYAHTYLLSSVLSSDYEDLTNDGPTDDDLGAYTRFIYSAPVRYNWRVPFSRSANRLANFNQGLITDTRDNKASYVFGEKELKYIERIETKTHIAIFELSDRQDGIGSFGENGGVGVARTQQLDRIYLYSKPEFEDLTANTTFFNLSYDERAKAAIKIAHFEYNYSLCQDLPNNINYNLLDQSIEDGKLTLERVYFTYRGSNMGKYTPYVFNYEGANPSYHSKAYDVWGNYKPMVGSCSPSNGEATTPEFPFVQQENRAEQDAHASAWTMTSIDLPSGSRLHMEYESDDYAYVQDKKTMQMFKVVGAGDTQSGSIGTNNLYQGSDDYDYIYVQIPDNTSENDFKEKFLGDIGQSDGNPLYFKFMLNMTSSRYDYVTGYVTINKEASRVFELNNTTYASIRLNRLKREGGLINSGQIVNPIAKAGWYFGRTYLNRYIYNLPAPELDQPGDLIALGQAFVGALGSVTTIFGGPNQALRNKNCAKRFNPEKSWIRLYHPTGEKFGGGIRVKNVQLHDNWDVMNSNENPVYRNFYGQDYLYENEDGGTSGVATFEPNGSKENPLILPFYDKHDKLVAPKESNYTEKPVGQSLYPSPTVTYGRVVVSNLKRERVVGEDADGPIIETLKKHATGRVISEFYTSKDFPTITDYTDITPRVDITGILGSVLKVKTHNNLTYSQGFVIRTNDMDGKQKSQKVQAEGQTGNDFISRVDYIYSTNPDGTLNNNLDVINEDGTVTTQPIGVTYDMVNDFRSYENTARVLGVDGNVAAILVFIGVLPVPTLLPVAQTHEKELKTATTTKVIHSVGILKEKIAYDLGSRVSTENLAWDANTGNVLFTRTVNEYSDHYYNLSYPAMWYYQDMGPAQTNLGISGYLSQDPATNSFNVMDPVLINQIFTGDANTIFTLGDELLIKQKLDNDQEVNDRAWVVGFQGNSLELINRNGTPYLLDDTLVGNPSFIIYRSGHRNLQMANMASVTSQRSPIISPGGITRISGRPDWRSYNIVNASAIEYSDAWNSQCEFRLPNPNDIEFDENGAITNYATIGINPYLFNVKGDWRAIKSYAYLTGRNNASNNYNPRSEGFFDTYRPFYALRVTGNPAYWEINNPVDSSNKWTFASEVTQYSPYGTELENKDALDRFSAAQYGYRYTLPTAVGSNTQYRELAFDGFEDYDYLPLSGNSSQPINPHFGFQDEVNSNSNAVITEEESHSGRRSIKLSPASSATITHRIIDCDTINSLPMANDDVINCSINNNLAIQVLANDDFGNDGAGGQLTIATLPPNYNSIDVDDNGTPSIFTDDFIILNSSYSGTQSFTYQICDANNDCDTATVTITCNIQAKQSKTSKD
ncbi:MAG: Ig-like domain-containing protein [Bacteroidota bacterium]